MVFFIGAGYSPVGELEATRCTRNNIITVERIVPHDQISRYIPTQFSRSYLPTIPEFRTRVIVEAPLSSLIGSYSQELDLVGFDPLFLGSLLLIGGLLGVLGALMAATSRLRDLEIL